MEKAQATVDPGPCNGYGPNFPEAAQCFGIQNICFRETSRLENDLAALRSDGDGANRNYICHLRLIPTCHISRKKPDSGEGM